MKPASSHQLPRVIPLAQVARELLVLDVHEVYKMASEGRLPGAFKIGKLWFVSVPRLIAAMQTDPNFEGRTT